ncbi:hypothetical protein SscP1EGY_1 [Streptomyces phage SscP1EGY]|nr:hypothetical protein SscP1EGY_1 [Streptomyces phage SscP1EGY]
MSDSNYLLSTKDNPYNPHTHWDDWWTWDFPRYDTLGLLGRVARTSDELPPHLEEQAINDAIDEIVEYNVSGKHIKVTESYKPTVSA